MYSINVKSEAIRQVQKYLRPLTPKMKIDTLGLYGVNTKAAIRAFQKQKGILETGITDKKTFDLLFTDYIRWVNDNNNEYENISYDIGAYSGEVANLKELIRKLNKYFPQSNYFEDGAYYSERFGDEVKRIRGIFRLNESTSFDGELYLRIDKEIKLRQKSEDTK